MNKIIEALTSLKEMGWEIIKANSEQVAVNNTENSRPYVFKNNLNYRTPTPFQWYYIDDELKRLKELEDGF